MIYRNEKIVSAVCIDNNIQLFEIQHIFYFDFHTIGDTLSRVTNDVIYKLMFEETVRENVHIYNKS